MNKQQNSSPHSIGRRPVPSIWSEVLIIWMTRDEDRPSMTCLRWRKYWRRRRLSSFGRPWSPIAHSDD